MKAWRLAFASWMLLGLMGLTGCNQANDEAPRAEAALAPGRAFYEQGRQALSDDQPQRAIHLFDKALDENPNDFDALYLRASAYRKLNNFDMADRDESLARKLDPAMRELLRQAAGSVTLNFPSLEETDEAEPAAPNSIKTTPTTTTAAEVSASTGGSPESPSTLSHFPIVEPTSETAWSAAPLSEAKEKEADPLGRTLSKSLGPILSNSRPITERLLRTDGAKAKPERAEAKPAPPSSSPNPFKEVEGSATAQKWGSGMVSSSALNPEQLAKQRAFYRNRQQAQQQTKQRTQEGEWPLEERTSGHGNTSVPYQAGTDFFGR